MKQNIITRKIQVYVNEPNKELKNELIGTIYAWRDLVRKGANAALAHKFIQDNTGDEIKEKGVPKENKCMNRENMIFRVLSDMMRGKVPTDIYYCLNQEIVGSHKKIKKDSGAGKGVLRSYKDDIPIPFFAKSLSNFKWNDGDKRFVFSLFGIPFATALGLDRSNNKTIIERCLNGEGSYKICSSKLQIDDKKKKMFLLLCVSFQDENVKLQKDKSLIAALGIEEPIKAMVGKKIFDIGTKDEFLHRRVQIQSAFRRAQISVKYNVGGKGREKKIQALDRFKKAEKSYVTAKTHEYSRRLVDLALKHECGKIVLVEHKDTCEKTTGDLFLLRNWSYHGLAEKLQYKCNLYGIELVRE